MMHETRHVPEELHGDKVVRAAAAHAGAEMGLESPDAALERIRRGDFTACHYFRYALARETTSILAFRDDTVQGGFIYPEDECETAPIEPVYLGVLVTRKSQALEDLATSLGESILAAAKARLEPFGALEHLLHIELLDDSDVSTHTGMAAALGSIHNPPVWVWSRG